MDTETKGPSTRAGAWIPEGWQIKRDQDWIAYQRPDGWTQSVTPHEPQHAHSQTLFMLLDAMLAAAPAVSAPAEPVGWAVYWGLPPNRKHSIHFERKTAEEVAAVIKSDTRIEPVFAFPGPVTAQGEHP